MWRGSVHTANTSLFNGSSDRLAGELFEISVTYNCYLRRLHYRILGLLAGSLGESGGRGEWLMRPKNMEQ